MKKMKIFFLAAALVLVTAGVFAKKSMFTSYTLWGYQTGVGYVQLTGSITLPVDALTTSQSTGNQAFIKSSVGTYGIYGFSTALPYVPVYVNF
jgi:hypothetical protein